MYVSFSLQGHYGHFGPLSLPQTIWSQMIGWVMNWKGCDRKKSWTNRGTIPGFAWMHWGKSNKTTMKISAVPVEISCQRIPNTSPDRSHTRLTLLPWKWKQQVPRNKTKRQTAEDNFTSIRLLRIYTSHMTNSLCVHFVPFLRKTNKN